MGVAAVVESGLCVPAGEEVVGTDHSPLLEQQEEEQVKVRIKCGFIKQDYHCRKSKFDFASFLSWI